jgi:hypothetical protein
VGLRGRADIRRAHDTVTVEERARAVVRPRDRSGVGRAGARVRVLLGDDWTARPHVHARRRRPVLWSASPACALPPRSTAAPRRAHARRAHAARDGDVAPSADPRRTLSPRLVAPRHHLRLGTHAHDISAPTHGAPGLPRLAACACRGHLQLHGEETLIRRRLQENNVLCHWRLAISLRSTAFPHAIALCCAAIWVHTSSSAHAGRP